MRISVKVLAEILAPLMLRSLPATARIPRSHVPIHAFVKANSCPATGEHRLPCPGYQIDHLIPLKCHGPDAPENMQWLTIPDHKAKTKREAKLCRTTQYIP